MRDYARRFGAWFLDAAGAHTTADFTGRQIKEFLEGGSHTCFANAVAKGYNPLLENCTSYVGRRSQAVGGQGCADVQAGRNHVVLGPHDGQLPRPAVIAREQR